MISDDIRSKRKADLAKDAVAGFDTSPEDDARLRQSSPETDDAAARYANESIRTMRQVMPGWPGFNDPDELEKLRQEYIESYRETFDENGRLLGNVKRKKQPQQAQEPEEKPFDQNAFFSNIDEMRKFTSKKL